MGRRKDPAALQAVKGNPGKRSRKGQRAEAAIEATPIDGRVPKFLHPAAREIWNLLAPELERLKFLRLTDTLAFARYCNNFAHWIELDSTLQTSKLVYWTSTPHGRMKRIDPRFQIRDRLEQRLFDIEVMFGLVPAARQRILMQMAGAAPQLPWGAENRDQLPANGNAGGTGQPAGEQAPTPAAPSPIGLLKYVN